MNPEDTLIYFGGEIKSLGGGRVGGYVVRFGHPGDTDSQGEFFTPETDYGLDVSAKSRIVYHHGMGRLKSRKLGVADLSMRPDGIWGEGRIDDPTVLREVEDGKLGWSSGSAARLTERRDREGAVEITSWPLIEVSLTPSPAERRNRAVCIKSDVSAEGWLRDFRSQLDGKADGDEPMTTGDAPDGDEKGKAPHGRCPECGEPLTAGCGNCPPATKSPEEPGVAPSLLDRTEALVADAGVLRGLYAKAREQRAADGRNLSRDKRDAIKALVASLAELSDLIEAPDRARAALMRRMLAQRIGASQRG